jgi:transcriptional regulator with XRE-family HTH domain
MTGEDLKSARTASNWTQSEAALRLGVTQAYLSMVERGSRPVSNDLASEVVRVFPLPATARPIEHRAVRGGGEEFFKRALGELGYPGFAYLDSQQLVNPAELLLLALDSEDLDARVTEALPWLPMHFPEMNWKWLTSQTKARDRQNRLAYVALLASDVAQRREIRSSPTIFALMWRNWNVLVWQTKTRSPIVPYLRLNANGCAPIDLRQQLTGIC